MNYKEICGDLFDHTDGRYIVQCVSADFAMGAGIAKAISDKYSFAVKDVPHDVREELISITGQGMGDMYPHQKILNLVTKQRYWHKPTYASIAQSLRVLRVYCDHNDINMLVMPRIGCGLDKLEWTSVRDIIYRVFHNSDIDILVCTL